MKKRNGLKKILSWFLVAAMLAGIGNIPARADSISYTDVKVAGIALDGDYLYPCYKWQYNTWFIYFKTEQALPSFSTVTLTAHNGTQSFTVPADRANDNWLLLRVENTYLPQDGDTTLTIDEQSVDINETTGIHMNSFSFCLAGGVWSMADTRTAAGTRTMPTVQYKTSLSLGTSWNSSTVGDSNGFYLYSADLDLPNVSSESWATSMTAVETDNDKCVFYGSKLWEYDGSDSKYVFTKIIHFAQKTYYVQLPEAATAGDIYRFQGYYKDDKDSNNIYGFAPITVQYDGTTWKDISSEISEQHSGYLYKNTADWAAGDAQQVFLCGTDHYLEGSVEKWTADSALLTAAGGSITLDGEAVSGYEFQKFSGVGNYYYLKLPNDAAEGQTLVVEGTFKASCGRMAVTFERSVLTWDGTKWSDCAAYAGSLSIEGSEYGSTDATAGQGIRLLGTDSYLSERQYVEWNETDAYLTAADDASGIYVDGTKAESGALVKYKGISNWYYLGGIITTASSVITVKGKFKANTGRLAVEFEESIFRYNGTEWVDAGKLAITGLPVDKSWLLPQKNADWPIWNVYLKTSISIPEDTTYNVKYKIDDGEEMYDSVFTGLASDNPNTVYTKIDTDKIDETKGTKVTYLAGTYANVSNAEDKLTLTEDFTFYVNQYGWSTKRAVITPDTTSQLEFTLATDLSNGSDNTGGFYLWLSGDDSLGYSLADDGTEWDATKYLVPVTDADTYFTDEGEGGLWKGDSKLSDAKIVKFKYNGKPCYYVFATAEEGAEYTVKGLFQDADGKKAVYDTFKVKYTNGRWSTGVPCDINGDSVADVRDLVCLKRYLADNTHSNDLERADVNGSGAVDEKDAASLRKVLVGAITYNADKEVSGTPTYTTDLTFEKAAYASVKIGDFDSGTNTITTYYDETTVDTDMQKYKAAGLTLLLSEAAAVHVQDSTKNGDIKKYLEAAERNGLGVLVYSALVQYMMTMDNLSAYDGDGGWQSVLDKAIAELRGYSAEAFKGFMIWDELVITYADRYNTIAGYLHEKYPELILLTSQLPTEGYDYTTPGPTAYTNDTITDSTKETAYKNYVRNFTTLSGVFTFDEYPLIGNILGSDSGKSVLNDWFLSHQYVADVAKEQNYSFYKGVTIQSHQGTYKSWWNKRYAPTTRADIGFQVYTSMSYGVKEIHYFTYNEHHSDTTIGDTIATNSSVYGAVSAVNAEIDKFADVYQAYSWRDTWDVASGGSYAGSTTATDRGQLQSAGATGARTLIGHMKDSDGFDGYMISNAANPWSTSSANVELNFKNATSALVYDFKAGTVEKQTLTDGKLSITVNVGAGVFVIPIR